jgi:hypothetical protein
MKAFPAGRACREVRSQAEPGNERRGLLATSSANVERSAFSFRSRANSSFFQEFAWLHATCQPLQWRFSAKLISDPRGGTATAKRVVDGKVDVPGDDCRLGPASSCVRPGSGDEGSFRGIEPACRHPVHRGVGAGRVSWVGLLSRTTVGSVLLTPSGRALAATSAQPQRGDRQ